MPASSRSIQQPSARDLGVLVPTVTSEETNSRVLEVFDKHRELISLPVLEGSSPMGLISRNIFMSQMSKPYYRELYEKKACIAFMDKNPLIVEADTPIETLAALAVKFGDKTLADGFLIVDDDRFIGVGSGLDLMQMMVELQSEKNRQVMQSIDYASVIQRAMLSVSREAMTAALSDACLVWEPRDIVGGDFYHFERFENGWFAAVADCTGHGVPGAFLTLIASSALTQALNRHGPADPALLMGEVNRSMKQALGQHTATERLSESDDGMDASFFCLNTAERTLTCANAKMPLFILLEDQDEVQTVEAERVGLGYVDTVGDMIWKNRTLQLAPGAMVFAATDGIIDQIGGAKNIAFGKQRLRDALLRHRKLPMQQLGQVLASEQKAYQGQQRRRDDLTFFGFRLD
ncbi:SpoIIE family protein phosphatase [Undibacterium sp. TJN25]|uniref:SpoIIE family protein phosphatase n=1 Tax=Undibacterium sp. TJN25 TaxID=3413056 RepID=UPI003BF0F552